MNILVDDPIVFRAFLELLSPGLAPRVYDDVTSCASTFSALLSLSENDFDEYVKTTLASNSARAAAAKILLPTNLIMGIKAVLFELHDRQRCNALPSRVMLENLDLVQIEVMKTNRTRAIQEEEERKKTVFTDLKVPKLTANNYATFHTSFTTLVSRKHGYNSCSLRYLLRKTDGNYDDPWLSREERLVNCTSFRGDKFKNDSGILYDLFVEHIGSEGVGSNIVNKYKLSRNGYQCYHDLENHFRNASYLDNIASQAKQSLKSLSYQGRRRPSI